MVHSKLSYILRILLLLDTLLCHVPLSCSDTLRHIDLSNLIDTLTHCVSLTISDYFSQSHPVWIIALSCLLNTNDSLYQLVNLNTYDALYLNASLIFDLTR